MNILMDNPAVNPFQTSEIRRIQDFYWVKFEDLWNETVLRSFWLKENEIKYCIDNKDKEFSIKSTEWFELREWVTTTKEFKRLQDFYGFTLQDTQDIEKLKKFWLKDEDIEFITGRKIETTSNNTTEDIKQPQTIKKKLWKK